MFALNNNVQSVGTTNGARLRKLHGLDNFKFTEQNSLWKSESRLAGEELCASVLSASRLTTCLRFSVM